MAEKKPPLLLDYEIPLQRESFWSLGNMLTAVFLTILLMMILVCL